MPEVALEHLFVGWYLENMPVYFLSFFSFFSTLSLSWYNLSVVCDLG